MNGNGDKGTIVPLIQVICGC